MEMIADWLKMIAAASIAGAVVYFLVPKGNLEKALRLVVAFSLITAILYPFLSGVFEKEFDLYGIVDFENIEAEADNSAEKYADLYSASLSDKSISIIKAKTEEFLDSAEFKYSDIEIITDITEKGGIVISRIKIMVLQETTPQDTSYIKEQIKELTGLEPEFYVSDGE